MTPRTYDVWVTALTLGVDTKWLDNLLSHHDIPGCAGARQGVARRISDQGLLAIALIHLLHSELGIPLGRAAALVRTAVAENSLDSIRTASGIRLAVPLRELEAELRARLPDALQAAPRIARGRKPRHADS